MYLYNIQKGVFLIDVFYTYSIEYGRTYTFNEAHRDAISCMDWNKSILATGSWDATVKIWQCNEINLVNLDHNLLGMVSHKISIIAV